MEMAAPQASKRVAEALGTAIATATALFPVNAGAQTAANAAPATPLSQEEIAYRTKMSAFVQRMKIVPSNIPQHMRDACNLRTSSMVDGILSLDSIPKYQNLLKQVSASHLEKLADYANCKDLTDRKILEVSSDSEYFLFRLLTAEGAVPAKETIPVNGYVKPARPAPGVSLPAPGKRAEASPALGGR